MIKKIEYYVDFGPNYSTSGNSLFSFNSFRVIVAVPWFDRWVVHINKLELFPGVLPVEKNISLVSIPELER